LISSFVCCCVQWRQGETTSVTSNSRVSWFQSTIDSITVTQSTGLSRQTRHWCRWDQCDTECSIWVCTRSCTERLYSCRPAADQSETRLAQWTHQLITTTTPGIHVFVCQKLNSFSR
jgi:hypothetical protein